MERAAKELGFSVQGPYVAHHVDMIKKWISLGLGWSLLPEVSFRESDFETLGIQRPSKQVFIRFCGVMLKGNAADVVLKAILEAKHDKPKRALATMKTNSVPSISAH
jgi:DNA-binding transcriptional LysR family regulator